MKPVRVAHFHSSLGIYGAERWTLTLLKHLDPARVRSLVFTMGTRPGSDAFHRLLEREGYESYHLPVPGKFSGAAVRAVRDLLREQNVEILHTHGYKSEIVGALAAWRLPLSVVGTVHGWSAHEGPRIRLYESLGRVFLRRFDRVYPLSPALGADLEARGFAASRLRLILNAVDVSAFDATYLQRRGRVPGECFELLFVGRLCRPKGVFELLRAFASARLVVPARLRLAGEGPERDALQALAAELGVADRVEFLGEVSPIAPVLATSHLLLLPSHSEGIPRVVMEAFAAGLPVVGSDIPGIRQLIEDGSTGWLVRVGDAHALSRAIEHAAAQPGLLAEVAMRARECVERKFSAARQAEEFHAEYRALARGVMQEERVEVKEWSKERIG